MHIRNQINYIAAIICITLLAGCMTSKRNSNFLFHCTFDSEESTRHPDVGPEAASMIGMTFVESDSGTAVIVANGTSIVYNFPTNYFGPKGTFIVRAKLMTNDDVCHRGPCFFNLQQYNEKTRKGPWCYLSYSTNNGQARSGYCGAVINPRGATIDGFWKRFNYSDTLGENWKDWHEFRMSWNFTDTTQKQLVNIYIDNKLMASNYKNDFNLESLRNAWKNSPGCLAFGQSPFGHNSPEPFLIDDFKILNTDNPDVTE